MAAGRGRKLWVVLLVLVLVLVGLLAIADRIAVGVAERTVARQAKQELVAHNISTPADPTVSIGGFPFLTQVARGRYDRVTIRVDRPSSNGVSLDALDVVATGVNAKTSALLNGTGQVTADNVTGTGTMGWASVTKLLDLTGLSSDGATVSSAGGNQVQISFPVSFAGVSTTMVATGSIVLSGAQTVRVQINDVKTQGAQLPPLANSLFNSVRKQLSITIQIPALPYHLVLKTVSTSATGLAVTATAQNVALGGQTGP